MEIKELKHTICRLGECPVWDNKNNCFYWSDILLGRIYKYIISSNEITQIFETKNQIGGMALCEDRNLFLFTDKGIEKFNTITKKSEDIYNMNFEDGERFNDIIVDPKGRVFAGTMDKSLSKGKLYLFDGFVNSPSILLENLEITNGMGFSCDNRKFYHTDSIPSQITSYDYDISTGKIENSKILITLDEKDGCPDGMTVDSENNILIACWGGQQILKINTNGNIIDKIPMPALQPSSLCFGGKDLKTVLITSAANDAENILTGYNNNGDFVGGKSYITFSKISGKSENLIYG